PGRRRGSTHGRRCRPRAGRQKLVGHAELTEISAGSRGVSTAAEECAAAHRRRHPVTESIVQAWYPCSLKQPVLVKLAPEPDEHAALLRTLEAFHAACNALAEVAFAQRIANTLALQPPVSEDVREWCGLASQLAIRASAKVSEAYKGDKGDQRV